eukprot:1160607-Pelagomonas_calceolata.AAC.2
MRALFSAWHLGYVNVGAWAMRALISAWLLGYVSAWRLGYEGLNQCLAPGLFQCLAPGLLGPYSVPISSEPIPDTVWSEVKCEDDRVYFFNSETEEGHACPRMHMCARTHTCAHTHTNTHTNTHIHTHIHTLHTAHNVHTACKHPAPADAPKRQPLDLPDCLHTRVLTPACAQEASWTVPPEVATVKARLAEEREKREAAERAERAAAAEETRRKQFAQVGLLAYHGRRNTTEAVCSGGEALLAHSGGDLMMNCFGQRTSVFS